MVKLVLLACLAGTASATQMMRCAATGDPHYKPFRASGKKSQYTVMGEGEFTLAQSGNFAITTCSHDVSIDRKTTKKLTWNRDFAVTDGTTTVKVEGGAEQKYVLTISGSLSPPPHTLGKYTEADSWSCDDAAKGNICREFMRTDDAEVYVMRKNKKAKKGNRVVVKFPKSNRVIIANIAAKKDSGKFGARTLFNIVVQVPKADASDYSGFCGETKNSIRGKIATDELKPEVPMLTSCTDGMTADRKVEDTIDLIKVIVDEDTNECDPGVTQKAVDQCTEVGADDFMGCVFDRLEGCDTAGVEDLIEKEVASVAYTCPENSYISAKTWPLVSFKDCECMWAYSRSDDDETCTPTVRTVVPTTQSDYSGACFCDPNAPRHCMHINDRSCGLPVLVSEQSKACDDPVKAMSPECKCATGTMDCTGKTYSLRMSSQPSLASPGAAFGQQPVVQLVDETGAVVSDSKTNVRISIANAQDENCKCGDDTPCRHNNIGDNTCHAKHNLFGDMVCPPGTTECLAKQAKTVLYQSIDGEDPFDSDSLFAKTTQCRQHAMSTSNTNFCSGMTPCKHLNDGSCVQKTAFYTQKIGAPAVEKKCIGVDFWRRAVPSPVTGWFFETDSTCSMDKNALGCDDPSHSYAMDKWCDHNCHPKYPGQPAFCPESHCSCKDAKVIATEEPADEWACPADRYDDGSCRCSPGTEFCGALESTLNNGVATFEHLTIGTPGRYQLLAEIVMPDQNTGSNNVRITTKTAVFDVVEPKKRGTTCRAQAFWRKPAMYNSTAHGEGQAWFYEDSKKCLSYSSNGKCERADSEYEYAMDKWCKANNCAEHTLESHCELYSPAADSAAATCASNKYDMFGDCCLANHVDACGVCGGDGSTCHVQTYIVEPIAVNGATDIIFNASLAHSSCDLKTPCMHLNDMTCVPKTINSDDPTIVGDDHHCYWDRAATADEQPNYKHGTWAIEGRLSKSIETMYKKDGTGNNDCYCPAGTVDITKKIQIEEKAKEDFVAALVKKVNDLTNGAATTPTEKVVLENSGAATAFSEAACAGSSVELTSIYNNMLCGTHFSHGALAGGKGSCTSGPDSCCNDHIRSISLPPMTTAKLYKHCSAPDAPAPKQVRYESVENWDPTQSKCIDMTRNDISLIIIEGNVLKVDAKVVGTTADCYETQCYDYVEACLKDDTCADILDAAEDLVTKGDSFIESLKVNTATTTRSAAYTNLLQCAGLAQPQCEPTIAADPAVTVTISEMQAVETQIKTNLNMEPIVETVAAPTPSPTPAPATPAPTVATPTEAPTKAPTPAPVKVVNPTRVNNAANLITTVTEVEPVIVTSCSRKIQPVARYTYTRTRTFSGESSLLFGRRRLLAASTTAFVQVSSSGNQAVIGTATTSPASAAQFASSTTTANTASASGMGAAGTALIAIGCVGLFGALVAGVTYQKSKRPAQTVSNSNNVELTTQRAAAEDQTDVL